MLRQRLHVLSGLNKQLARQGMAATSLRTFSVNGQQCAFAHISMRRAGPGASTMRCFQGIVGTSNQMRCYNSRNALKPSGTIQEHKAEEEEQKQEEEEGPFGGPGKGYLPFPPPFHTVNICAVLLIANLVVYCLMNFTNDDVRDFIVEHCTLSHANMWRIYPLLTHAFYQENFLQLAIDSWLLWQFGNTMLGFFGGARMFTFWAMCTLGGACLHLARQMVEIHYVGMDPMEARGRAYGSNPFILGLVAVEGLIFRHLNFLQNPPIPFLVLTAFVMVIDVWRIFTTKPEEHGASTGGALVAYLFWLLPTRFMGLDKLTAAM